MDLLFENHTKVTQKLLEEFSKETYYAFSKKIRLLCLIMFVVQLFAFMLGFVVSGFSFSIRQFSFLLLAAFFLVFYFKGYLLILKGTLKNLESLHGELPHNVKKFYKDNFETVTNLSQLTIEYNQITKILETRNLFIIMIGNQGLFLSKEGFTKGDFSDFKIFIENKIKKP